MEGARLRPAPERVGRAPGRGRLVGALEQTRRRGRRAAPLERAGRVVRGRGEEGVREARSRFAPTPPLPFLANALGLTALEGATTEVRFRLTALGGGLRVDDVYVDPWKID